MRIASYRQGESVPLVVLYAESAFVRRPLSIPLPRQSPFGKEEKILIEQGRGER